MADPLLHDIRYQLHRLIALQEDHPSGTMTTGQRSFAGGPDLTIAFENWLQAISAFACQRGRANRYFLTDRERDILACVFWGEMNYTAIARRLRLSVSTVGTDCRRGLFKLAYRLDLLSEKELKERL